MNIPMCRAQSNIVDFESHSNFIGEEKICKEREFIKQNLPFLIRYNTTILSQLSLGEFKNALFEYLS